MINLLQAPVLNSAVLDGNNTFIKLKRQYPNEVEGLGETFFEAVISIDDTELVTQSWSLDEDEQATFNVKHLYRDYFKTTLSSSPADGFHLLSGYCVKVGIVVNEKTTGTLSLIDTLTLPTFYLVQSRNPQRFTPGLEFSLLDFPFEEITIPDAGSIRFPIFLLGDETITVSHLDDELNEVTATLHQYVNPDTITPKVLFYSLDISSLSLASDVTEFNLRFTAADTVETIKVNIRKVVDFPVKSLLYTNNNAIYLQAYLFGERTEENQLRPSTYTQEDDSEKVYFIDDIEQLSINTGHGYQASTLLALAISRALEVKVWVDSGWVDFNTTTKKITTFEDGAFVYNNRLTFERKAAPAINTALFSTPDLDSLVVAATGNTDKDVTVATLSAAYQGPFTIQYYIIEEPPVNGSLLYEDGSGVHDIFINGVDNPANFTPFFVPHAGLVRLIYRPNTNEYGEPMEEIDYTVQDEYYFSETALITVNIPSFTPANQPPTISTASAINIAIDGSGDGTLQIEASIIEPEGDAMTILWEALGGAPITFDDNSIEEPEITITGASHLTEYEIRVTATDTDNTLVSQKTITVTAQQYQLALAVVDNGWDAGKKEFEYEVNITNGIAAGTMELKCSAYLPESAQYVRVNAETNEELLLSSFSREGVLEFTLDGSGEISLKLNLGDNNEAGGLEATLVMQNPSTGMYVLPGNSELIAP